MSTPTWVARCCALTTMPFSAAKGVAEAALAAETATRDQTQAISMQAPVNVPKMEPNRLDRIFNSPLETSKDMKIFSPSHDAKSARQCGLGIPNLPAAARRRKSYKEAFARLSTARGGKGLTAALH